MRQYGKCRKHPKETAGGDLIDEKKGKRKGAGGEETDGRESSVR